MAEVGVSSSQANSAWSGAAVTALATLCVLIAWGEQGIMSSHPLGAHGRLHDFEPGAAGSCEWSVSDPEPPMSMPAMSIPAMPGIDPVSPSPSAPGRQVKPLPTSVSWASSNRTRRAVARRKQCTHERYGETAAAHSPECPYGEVGWAGSHVTRAEFTGGTVARLIAVTEMPRTRYGATRQ